MSKDKKQAAPKREWPVMITPEEGTMVVFRGDAAFIKHVKSDDPCLYGYTALTEADEKKVAKLFNDGSDGDAVGPVSLKPYAKDFGIDLK